MPPPPAPSQLIRISRVLPYKLFQTEFASFTIFLLLTYDGFTVCIVLRIRLFQCDTLASWGPTGATRRVEKTSGLESEMDQGMETGESVEVSVEESMGASGNTRVDSNSETSPWVGL